MAKTGHLIIDGYNVLLTGHRGHIDHLETAREDFIRALERSALKNPAEITVVFDTAKIDAGFGLPKTTRDRDVEVVFAVNHKDADEEIRARIENHDFPHTVTVVTSDREIQRFVKAMGANILPAIMFWKDLMSGADARAEAEQADLTRRMDKPLGKTEVDEWYRLFNQDGEPLE